MVEHAPEVDAYVAAQPPAVRAVLERVRAVMHEAAPGCTEVIRYVMPTLQRDGRSLVHFAAWKGHLSVYPLPDGDAAFEALVAPYRSGRATAKIPWTEPFPYDVVRRVVEVLVEQRG